MKQKNAPSSLPKLSPARVLCPLPIYLGTLQVLRCGCPSWASRPSQTTLGPQWDNDHDHLPRGLLTHKTESRGVTPQEEQEGGGGRAERDPEVNFTRELEAGLRLYLGFVYTYIWPFLIFPDVFILLSS